MGRCVAYLSSRRNPRLSFHPGSAVSPHLDPQGHATQDVEGEPNAARPERKRPHRQVAGLAPRPSSTCRAGVVLAPQLTAGAVSSLPPPLRRQRKGRERSGREAEGEGGPRLRRRSMKSPGLRTWEFWRGLAEAGEVASEGLDARRPPSAL